MEMKTAVATRRLLAESMILDGFQGAVVIIKRP
jgi:hypothetical protein